MDSGIAFGGMLPIHSEISMVCGILHENSEIALSACSCSTDLMKTSLLLIPGAWPDVVCCTGT